MILNLENINTFKNREPLQKKNFEPNYCNIFMAKLETGYCQVPIQTKILEKIPG